MRSWRTSLSGLVTALAGFALFSPSLFIRWPWVGEVSKYVMAGGIASMGLTAKDSIVHSTADEVTVSTIKEDKKV